MLKPRERGRKHLLSRAAYTGTVARARETHSNKKNQYYFFFTLQKSKNIEKYNPEAKRHKSSISLYLLKITLIFHPFIEFNIDLTIESMFDLWKTHSKLIVNPYQLIEIN